MPETTVQSHSRPFRGSVHQLVSTLPHGAFFARYLGYRAPGSMTGGSDGGCSPAESTQEVAANTYNPSPNLGLGQLCCGIGVSLRGRLQEAPWLDTPVFSRKLD